MKVSVKMGIILAFFISRVLSGLGVGVGGGKVGTKTLQRMNTGTGDNNRPLPTASRGTLAAFRNKIQPQMSRISVIYKAIFKHSVFRDAVRQR